MMKFIYCWCNATLLYACMTAALMLLPLSAFSVEAQGGDQVFEIEVAGIPWRVHVFTTVGTNDLTVLSGVNVEYLIVAGCGGGGNHRGNNGFGSGGGGAGEPGHDAIEMYRQAMAAMGLNPALRERPSGMRAAAAPVTADTGRISRLVLRELLDRVVLAAAETATLV